MESTFLNGGMIGVTLDFGATDQYIIGNTQQRDTIAYVGGRTQTTSSTSNFNISLTSLTGGLATAPATDDLVLVVRTWAGSSDRSMATSSTGWTEIAELWADDTNDTNFAVYWKIMGATPDTTMSFVGHLSGDSSAFAVYVFRNIDLTTPLDVTSTTSTRTNTAIPDPPAITPTTTNSIIVVASGAAHNAGTRTFTASYLNDFITVGISSTYDATVGVGWIDWTSGSYNPAAWTFSTTDSTAYSAASITIAIRPRLVDSTVFGNRKNSGMWNLEAAYDYAFSQYTAPSQVLFTTTGAQSWTVPPGITSISAVCVGGGGGGGGGDGGASETNGGGGGGGLAYGNNISVTPGETLTVTVGAGGTSTSGNDGNNGGSSSIARGATVLLQGGGGSGGLNRGAGGSGGTSTGTNRTAGGTGGAGGGFSAISGGSGAGGAGGYSGNGGAGGLYNAVGSAGSGGAGGGGAGRQGTASTGQAGGSGGGVGVVASGSNGAGGSSAGAGTGGGGGSGGTAGSTNTNVNTGSLYGGGGGGAVDAATAGASGGQGAVRIIWGPNRSYPTNSGDVF